MYITVQRRRKTDDGIFGQLTIITPPFACVTVENLLLAVAPGEYPVFITMSPRFKRFMPWIDVPGRTGIRLHWANYPTQLEGCIAVGSKEEKDAVDNSHPTFDALYQILLDTLKKELVYLRVEEAYT